ncbi:hypothetical protein [Spirilliplanes yamanashiensis]|uniref:Uncharacterized protein n=1 Tax=Spirilliplanes yamanashiensis TaxID=42233 RepID=A0A8J3Y4A0_9ACTN|nr:hypothetical protein [Spirilliplanes yamanashiensis]MDP9819709.1 hypothetical protein [Spirilliplanes yamanashiensis]GIJ01471.1 hypothetical protein Sya03_08230 [Spirilliplanes yamanashiensis]
MSIFRRTREAAPLPWPGDSLPGLAARWVRWAAAAGPASNPIADATGADAHRNQPGDVFFLAGTYGETVTRRCTVPAGVPLFFPLVNRWAPPAAGNPEMYGASGDATVDGRFLAAEEVFTAEPFEVAGALRNGVTGTRKPVAMRVWGLWARAEPLAPGGHEVRLRGRAGRDFLVDVTYELTAG